MALRYTNRPTPADELPVGYPNSGYSRHLWTPKTLFEPFSTGGA